MVERQANSNTTLEKVRQFTATLAQWDNRIIEVFVIGYMEGDSFPPDRKIDLICRFDPDSAYSLNQHISVLNLIFREDYERISELLEITNPIDFGFIVGNTVYLPNGKILSHPGEYRVIWSKNNE